MDKMWHEIREQLAKECKRSDDEEAAGKLNITAAKYMEKLGLRFADRPTDRRE
jgi:hypothetical protein